MGTKLETIIRDFFPRRIHELLIGIHNRRLYNKRHSGCYKKQREYYRKWDQISDQSLVNEEQQQRLTKFLNFVAKNSEYYSKYISVRPIWRLSDLKTLPVITKNDLVLHSSTISTISDSNAITSYTGGTTGASLKVLYTYADIQERFAALDNFRSSFGYELGMKTAWFSGKELLSKKDIRQGIFFKDDRINNIRFFSTFHFNQLSAASYWKSLREFKPEFIVGFPFSVYEICRFAEHNDLHLDLSKTVFFPTAETVTPEFRRCINKVLNCKIVDQYASSEGAPFIFECKMGRLHIHPLTGIFEVVDDDLNPTNSGQILVTAFATTGTPLVRYKIGDSITLSQDNACLCGSVFPLVDRIEGRSSDYLVSNETGRISGSNLGNSTKYVEGILYFQAVQDDLLHVNIKVVANELFDKLQKAKFMFALRERLGDSMDISVEVVDSIAKGKSGKFKFIINRTTLA